MLLSHVDLIEKLLNYTPLEKWTKRYLFCGCYCCYLDFLFVSNKKKRRSLLINTQLEGFLHWFVNWSGVIICKLKTKMPMSTFSLLSFIFQTTRVVIFFVVLWVFSHKHEFTSICYLTKNNAKISFSLFLDVIFLQWLIYRTKLYPYFSINKFWL
jgi:hypothetical protein